ncbi:hypothetical protein D3C71_1276940 [compost metagenome]
MKVSELKFTTRIIEHQEKALDTEIEVKMYDEGNVVLVELPNKDQISSLGNEHVLYIYVKRTEQELYGTIQVHFDEGEISGFYVDSFKSDCPFIFKLLE